MVTVVDVVGAVDAVETVDAPVLPPSVGKSLQLISNFSPSALRALLQ